MTRSQRTAPRHRIPRALAACATGAACVMAGTSSASAEILEHVDFHETFSFVADDYCGVEGLSVNIEQDVSGRFLGVSRGPDGIAYFQEIATFDETHTNTATGETVRVVSRTINKDLHIVDDGETLTITVLATGNATVYDSDGRAIARNPGQVRYQVLIDHGGTPDDPSDDEILEFLGFVKESTGRSDDFCTALVDALS